ncbi:MAG: hypothetical protein IPL39_15535 [Opitutaceae bacterium]|nr:hypothetical protein [Opitutaceae bacterium]
MFLWAQGRHSPSKDIRASLRCSEVIGYILELSKTWFESTTGERWEIYDDLLRLKVLEPKEHAEREFELFLPTRGGTYLSPKVEYQERIAVRVASGTFAKLLNNPQHEYRPIRSPMIEHAIQNALEERKKTTTPNKQPAP